MKSISRGYIEDGTECIVTEDCIYIGHYLSGEKIYPDQVNNWNKTKQYFIDAIEIERKNW